MKHLDIVHATGDGEIILSPHISIQVIIRVTGTQCYPHTVVPTDRFIHTQSYPFAGLPTPSAMLQIHYVTHILR